MRASESGRACVRRSPDCSGGGDGAYHLPHVSRHSKLHVNSDHAVPSTQLTSNIVHAVKRRIRVLCIVSQDHIKVIGNRRTLVRALESMTAVNSSRDLVSAKIFESRRTGSLVHRRAVTDRECGCRADLISLGGSQIALRRVEASKRHGRTRNRESALFVGGKEVGRRRGSHCLRIGIAQVISHRRRRLLLQ